MGITDITTVDLQDDIIGPIAIGEYRDEGSNTMKDGGYMNNLAGYHSSVFQDFESYLRTEIYLVEDGNKLVLDKHNSSFNTYEIQPGIYTFKDLSNLFLTFSNLIIQHLAS